MTSKKIIFKTCFFSRNSLSFYPDTWISVSNGLRFCLATMIKISYFEVKKKELTQEKYKSVFGMPDHAWYWGRITIIFTLFDFKIQSVTQILKGRKLALVLKDLHFFMFISVNKAFPSGWINVFFICLRCNYFLSKISV